MNHFWFVMDEITARINEIKRQRARGAVIKEAHAAKLEKVATELRAIARKYDR